jgi:hypothetical protein
MPYNRDEVIASVTAFYDFLTTHLHFYPSNSRLRHQPDGHRSLPTAPPVNASRTQSLTCSITCLTFPVVTAKRSGSTTTPSARTIPTKQSNKASSWNS